MLNTTFRIALVTLLLLLPAMAQKGQKESARPRARDIGLRVGVLPAGRLNAITDVAGVRVGHTTLIRGDGRAHRRDRRSCRTRATSSARRCPRRVFVGNGFGKLAGSTQVEELGEIETPILLTSTLNVPRVADALLDWMLALPGNEDVRSRQPGRGRDQRRTV